MQWFGATFTKLVDKIKERFLPETSHGEIPEQVQINKSIDPDAVLSQAAELLNCEIKRLRIYAGVSDANKTNRELLIYMLWQSGQLTNHQIGEKSGLTYSAVSRRVGAFKDLLRKTVDYRISLTKLNR